MTEWRGCQVLVFNPNGERLRSFGAYRSGRGKFNNPAGVALDCDNNILVVDSSNHRVQKFSVTGELLTAGGTHGSGCLQFTEPRGIAVTTRCMWQTLGTTVFRC